MKHFMAAIAIAPIFQPFQSKAATIVQTAEVTLPIHTERPFVYFAAPVLIRQFNPALGTLTGLHLAFASSYEYTVTVDSPDIPNACCVYGGYEAEFGIYGIGVSAGDYVNINVPSLAGIHTKSEAGSFSGDSGWLPIAPDYDEQVIGTGNTNSAFYGQFWLFHEINGTGWVRSSGHVDLKAVVTYQYNPVPEPISWAMMAVGFALIGETMRHRRKRLSSLA